MTEDRKILQEEIEEIKNSNADRKKIILKSALKLEQSPEYEEKSSEIISKRLCVVFKDYVSSRYIRKILPEKYKQPYEKNKNNPRNEIELLISLLSLLKEAINYLREDMHKNPELAQIMREKFPDLFTRESIDKIKEQQIEWDLIRESLDDRRKFTAYQKVMIRMLLIDNSRNKLAKTFHCSTKYLKKIEEDEEITRIIEEIRECPSCKFNFVQWFKNNKQREKLGKKIIMPLGLRDF